MEARKTRRLLLLPALIALAAAPVLAQTATSSRTKVVPPLPQASATPANPSGQSLDPDAEPAGEALPEGERFRAFTTITEAEVNAVDPSYREWVRLIRSGLATKPVMRLYAFYKTRLDPFDSPVPQGWRERALAFLRDDARTRQALAAYGARALAPAGSPSSPFGGSPSAPSPSLAASAGTVSSAAPASATPGISPYGRWIPIGPYTIPGRALGLDRPSGDANTLYVANADGGLFRTTDGAATWQSLTPYEAAASGGSVLLDPNDPRTIYFGTGEGNGAIDNYGGIGVLKSKDGGITWTASNAFSGSVRRLAMHPSEPTRLYAAGDSGCYLSTDAGATFNLIGGGLPQGNGASDVVVRPDNANVIFCAIWGGSQGGIWRSTDHGATWSALTNGLPALGSVARISLGISRSNPNYLLAGIDQSNGTVYKSTDGGNTWAQLGGGITGFCGGQCWYDNSVGFDAADPNVLYANGIGAHRSNDGGATWGAADAGVHVDHHFVFSPAPGEVLYASDGGVFRSTDQGVTWSNWGLGMDSSQYYGICRHPTDPDWAAGGTQDNGSHRRRLTDNPNWQQILGGDGGMCMTGPSQVVLGEYQNQSIQRSADGGATFSDANGGIGRTDPHPWVGIMVADPSNRNNMWTVTNKVYRSTDARATNWVSVSTPLYFSVNGTALEVAPSNSNVVYVGFDAGGLYRSVNALSTPPTWTSIRQSYLPQRGVRRIRVNATNSDTAYAVFSGYGAGKIWKTTNGGSAWTDVTGNLPDVPVNDLVLDQDNPGTIVAATDLGIYRSDADGGTWYGWSAGFPTTAAIELTYDRTNDRLRAGTHGRSMWDWREAAPTPTAVPDGFAVAGRPMLLDKAQPGKMRVQWDTLACTARDYNLFWGDLANVSTYTYGGAVCGLGTSGTATVDLPATASGNAFFVIAATDGSGNEGPHLFTAPGVPAPANGIGLCSITQQVASATCP